MTSAPRPTRDERERVLEEFLVLRAREGGPAARGAFEELVRRWHERLWRHAFRLTGREDVAGDVMQESWLAVVRGLDRLEDPGAFRRWAYTIVTRATVNHLRRLPREQPRAPEHLDGPVEHDEAGDERTEAVRLLRRALRRLEPDERTLISLRYLEGFDLESLAGILDVPEGTVKSRLHRVRQRLKDLITRLEP